MGCERVEEGGGRGKGRAEGCVSDKRREEDGKKSLREVCKT